MWGAHIRYINIISMEVIMRIAYRLLLVGALVFGCVFTGNAQGFLKKAVDKAKEELESKPKQEP